MSEYVQREFCVKLAEILRGTEKLYGAKIVVEDLADVDSEVQKASVGVCVVIACTGHERGSGATLSGQLDFEILCTEKPKANRAAGRKTWMSAANAAEVVARALDHVKVDGFGTVVYEAMRRQDEDDRAQTLVTLHAEQSIDPSQALCWGLADGSQSYGEIISKRTGRGGEAQFETDRTGHGRFVGVRDPHVTIDLTANILAGTEDIFPAIGDTFSCPVEGVRTTFVCTASELAESTADGKTIHLAGRTVG